MHIKRDLLFTLPVIFIWIGFIGAISFMEAWLKFRAPGVTLPVGLGIGKLVFAALNKMECFFSVILLMLLIRAKVRLFSGIFLCFLIPVLIVLLQSFWALPALDKIADLYILHQSVPHSNLHFYYVGMESMKLACLVFLGIKTTKKIYSES